MTLTAKGCHITAHRAQEHHSQAQCRFVLIEPVRLRQKGATLQRNQLCDNISSEVRLIERRNETTHLLKLLFEADIFEHAGFRLWDSGEWFSVFSSPRRSFRLAQIELWSTVPKVFDLIAHKDREWFPNDANEVNSRRGSREAQLSRSTDIGSRGVFVQVTFVLTHARQRFRWRKMRERISYNYLARASPRARSATIATSHHWTLSWRAGGLTNYVRDIGENENGNYCQMPPRATNTFFDATEWPRLNADDRKAFALLSSELNSTDKFKRPTTQTFCRHEWHEATERRCVSLSLRDGLERDTADIPNNADCLEN